MRPSVSECVGVWRGVCWCVSRCVLCGAAAETVHMTRLHTYLARMKARTHWHFLLCLAGVCLLSLMYYYKTLQEETWHQRLSAYSSRLAGINRLLWRHTLTATPTSVTDQQKKTRLKSNRAKNPADQDLLVLSSSGTDRGLLTHSYLLQDGPASHLIHTPSGSPCFAEGTDMESDLVGEPPSDTRNNSQDGATASDCFCRRGWHGPNCGVPTVVQHSNLPTKSHLKLRKVPRRIINAVNINHEFDLLHARFHELLDTVDVFVVCESNYTAYGQAKPLTFLRLLLNGTFDYVKHKIVYVFLDHFPKGAQTNGWIVDDYLRTYLTKSGLMRIRDLRPDDVFLLDDADEIPLRDGILFLKLYDGWTEPFGIHMRKSLYGFYWRQPGTLDIVSGCTVDMLRAVYRGDGILLRRRDYHTVSGFREYERRTRKSLMPWSIGSLVHHAGWHCSWCFTPDGIYYKLISAQNGDFPRWGDFEDKRKLSYIRELIRTGGWFDGSLSNRPPADPKEHMFAPKYLLDNYNKYRYLLENPYTVAKKSATIP